MAIESDGVRTLIRRNTITSTLFVASTLFGIQVDAGAAANRVEANTIDRPGFIGVDDSGTSTLTTANLIVGQIYPAMPATGGIALRDGIRVEPPARGTLLQANITTRNGDDGIDVESPATTITANVANDNTASTQVQVCALSQMFRATWRCSRCGARRTANC